MTATKLQNTTFLKRGKVELRNFEFRMSSVNTYYVMRTKKKNEQGTYRMLDKKIVYYSVYSYTPNMHSQFASISLRRYIIYRDLRMMYQQSSVMKGYFDSASFL